MAGWKQAHGGPWVRFTLLAVIAITTIALGARAQAESASDSCYDAKLQCLKSCEPATNETSQNEHCSSACDEVMARCVAQREAELKEQQWKKRCLSFPAEEHYFTDIIGLAWARTSAVLRTQSLLFKYMRGRLIVAAPTGVSAAPWRRAMFSLIGTLNRKNAEFLAYFGTSAADRAVSSDSLYRQLSSGASAFEVLSDAASKLTVNALLTTDDNGAAIVGSIQSLTVTTEKFNDLNAPGISSPELKTALAQQLEDTNNLIMKLLSEIDEKKSQNDASERKELLNYVQGMQSLCRAPPR